MPDYFFDLREDDQKDLLEVGFSQLGMQPFVLEKDVWVCWVLQQLFSMPDKKEMAFKGGTSLSKVYRVIDRFSEDIDVTIDYRESSSPITGNESRSQLQKLCEQLRKGVLEYTTEVIVPHLNDSLQKFFGENYGSIEVAIQIASLESFVWCPVNH